MGFNLANMGYAAYGMSAAAHDEQARRSQMLGNEAQAVNVRAAQGKEAADAAQLERLRGMQKPGFGPPPVTPGSYNIGGASAAPAAPDTSGVGGGRSAGIGGPGADAKFPPVAGAPTAPAPSGYADDSWNRAENYRNENIGKKTARELAPAPAARTAANARGLAGLRQSRGLGTGEEFGAGSGSGGPEGDNTNPAGYWASPNFQAEHARLDNAPPGTVMTFDPLHPNIGAPRPLPAGGAGTFDQQFPAPPRPPGQRNTPVPGTTAPPAAARPPGAPNASNPGNIRPVGASTGFQQYGTPEEGLKAIDQNLQAYYTKHGINTLTGIISRWAPPSENDTASYIADVSRRLGVDPNQPLDMTNPVVRHALATGIMIHEQGSKKMFGAAPAAAAGGPPRAGLAPPTAQASGQPAAAPAAAPAPTQYPTQGVQFVQGQGQNHNLADLEHQHAILQTVIDTSRDPSQVAQAMSQQTQLRAAARESHIFQLGHAASMGNPQAIHEALALYSRAVGQPLGITHAGNGQYVLVDEQGKPLIPPQGLSAITSTMVGHLSDTIKAQNAAQAAAMGMEYAKAQGKAQGELPANLELERQKGATVMAAHEIMSNGQLLLEIQKHRMSREEVGGAQITPDGNLWIYDKMGNPRFAVPGGQDMKTKAWTAPTVMAPAR